MIPNLFIIHYYFITNSIWFIINNNEESYTSNNHNNYNHLNDYSYHENSHNYNYYIHLDYLNSLPPCLKKVSQHHHVYRLRTKGFLVTRIHGLPVRHEVEYGQSLFLWIFKFNLFIENEFHRWKVGKYEIEKGSTLNKDNDKIRCDDTISMIFSW